MQKEKKTCSSVTLFFDREFELGSPFASSFQEVAQKWLERNNMQNVLPTIRYHLHQLSNNMRARELSTRVCFDCVIMWEEM